MPAPRLSSSFPGQGGANNDYWSNCQQTTGPPLMVGLVDSAPAALRHPPRCNTSPVSLSQLPPTPAADVAHMERHPSASCLSALSAGDQDGLAGMDVFGLGLLEGLAEEVVPAWGAPHASWQAQPAQPAQQAQQAQHVLVAQQQLLAAQRAEQQRWCEAAAALLRRPQAGGAQGSQRHSELAALLQRHEEEASHWEQRRQQEQQQWEVQRAVEQARWEAQRAAEQEAWEARRREQRRQWEALHGGAAGGALDGPQHTTRWLGPTSAPQLSTGSLPMSMPF